MTLWMFMAVAEDLCTLVTCNSSAGTPATSYFASADPSAAGTSGTWFFATDKRGIIFYDLSATIANPIPPAASTFVQ